MSNQIEDRVVEMKFNNGAFEAGVAKTLGTLQKLREKLNFTGATKGFDEISKASNKVELSHISRGLDELSSKFSALSVAGVTALATIANRAVDAGLNLAKSLTIGPIGDGFNDYNAKLTSVQTVMNSTGKSIGYVSHYFDQLDTYADQTIFSLSDMTSAFAKFTNAGISVEQAVPAIKGIGNLTALAGQGAESAQIAYYNLSQSLAGGFLSTIDYKSLQNANIATKDFRDRLTAAAVAAGTLKKVGKNLYTYPGGKKAINEQQLFTEALSSGWANAKILTSVLNEYGDASKGVGKIASDAATKVKTLPQLLETLRAQVGTGWTETFQSLIGNVTEATALFTGLSNTIGGYIGRMNDSRNKTIRDFRSWGGRAALIQAVKNAFQALLNVLGPIRDAFREVFPKTTARKLASLAIKFRMFTQTLIANKETMDNIRRTFVGFFTIIKIVVGAIALGVKGFFNLIRVVSAALPGLLSLTAVAGDLVKGLANILLFKNPLAKFFKGLSGATADVLVPIVTFLSKVLEAISKFATGDVTGFTTKFKDAFSSLGDVVDAVGTFIEKRFSGVTDIFTKVGDFLSFIGEKLAGTSSDIGKQIGGVAGDVGKFLAGLGTGAGQKLAEVINTITDAVKGLIDKLSFKFSFNGLSKGADDGVKSLHKLDVVGTSIKKVFEGIGTALKKIGDFLGPVIGSILDIIKTTFRKISDYVKTLDFQDVVALVNTGLLLSIYRSFNGFLKSISKTAGKFGNTADSLTKTFNQLTGNLKTMQNTLRAKILKDIAVAIAILAASAFVLSKVDPTRLGITAGIMTGLFAQLIGSLALITKISPKSNKSLLVVATTLQLLAGSILTMAIAMRILATIDTNNLFKGIGAIAALLGVMAAAVKIMNGSKGIVAAAFGLNLMAVALVGFAGAIKLFASFKDKTFSEGFKRIAYSLGLLVLAFRLLPQKNAAEIAASLLLAAVAIKVLASALKTMAKFTKGQIAKSLIFLGGTIAVLAGGMFLLSKAGPAGATSLIAIAFALRILTPALERLGNMSLGAIVKSLIALTGVLIILGGASFVLTPLIPVIIGLAIAIGLLGGGVLAAGAGIALFAAGLAALATIGAAALAGMLSLIPLFAQQIGLGIIAFLKVISDAIPRIVALGGTLIVAFVSEIAKDAPILFQKGIDLLIGFLDVFNKNAHIVSTKVLTFMLNLATELKNNAAPIADAGLVAFLAVLNAFSEAVETHAGDIYDASYKFGQAIGDGMKAGIGGSIKGFFGSFGIPDSVTGFLSPISNLGGGGGKPQNKSNVGHQTFIPDNNKTAPTTPTGTNNPATRGGRTVDLRVASTNLDTAPTITPVVNLDPVREAAKTVARLMSSVPITADTSTIEARNIAVTQPATATGSSDQVKVAEVKFEQHNTSPRALSRKEIYRRTNNQLAQAKQILGMPLDLVPTDA